MSAGIRLVARRRREYIRLVIEPYRSDRLAVDALVSTFAALHSLVSVRGPRRILTGQPSVALEIHHQIRSGGAPLVWLAICAPRRLGTQVGEVVRATYPNCRLRRVTRNVGVGGRIVRLHKHRLFTDPVRRIGDVDPDRPPVERLLRAMGAAGGSSIFQIALTPAPLALGRVVGRAGGKRKVAGEAGSSETDEPRVVGPFFGADFRVIGQRAGQLATIAAELRTGRAPNRLVGRRARGRGRMWARRIERGEANPVPTVLRATYAAEEVAAIWHLPSPGFAALPLVRSLDPGRTGAGRNQAGAGGRRPAGGCPRAGDDRSGAPAAEHGGRGNRRTGQDVVSGRERPGGSPAGRLRGDRPRSEGGRGRSGAERGSGPAGLHAPGHGPADVRLQPAGGGRSGRRDRRLRGRRRCASCLPRGRSGEARTGICGTR